MIAEQLSSVALLGRMCASAALSYLTQIIQSLQTPLAQALPGARDSSDLAVYYEQLVWMVHARTTYIHHTTHTGLTTGVRLTNGGRGACTGVAGDACVV